MQDSPQNSLCNASSAYLRSAMHQPVDWQPWGEAAFARAVAENKPVLLDIGAVWCHWCHVMDRESYEDAETAALINEKFVAVKVDRDERPDVDSRYQAAVAAISGQGGWPLTAFLTPEGKPYFGGTYFPPDERMGRPSFQRVLLTMAAAFRDTRDEVEESAGSVMEAIEYSEAFSGGATDLEGSSAGIALIDKLVTSALGSFDPRNGGFGSQPKFPHPAVIDMLVDAASRSGANGAKAAEAALTTLRKMHRGGIFDQLAGGFHRYSVDEHWIVPHFEKMSYDNSELLRSYVHAFQSFADPECASAARETMRWMDEWLSDRELGGFYASQDADLSLEDDGNYFTWSRAEAAAVLSVEELAAAEVYFDIGAVGDMHHDPSRNVLFTPLTLDEAALRFSMDRGLVQELVISARRKLYRARLQRPTPFVDRTMYTGWNCMCVSAYLEAGRVLQEPEAVSFALRSLDRVVTAAWSGGHLKHVVAYGNPGAAETSIPGGLDDYVFLGHALLDAWQGTGEMRYLHLAQEVASALRERFADRDNGGFFDTEQPGPQAIGALSTRRKPLQDAPTPAGNPTAAALFLRIYALTGDESYRETARATLECFAGIVEHFGLYAASFALALGRLARPAVQVVIVGEGQQAQRMETTALARFAVNKTVLRLSRTQLSDLPPALAETLPHLPDDGRSLALVCVGHACETPVYTPEELQRVLHHAF